MYLTHKDSLVLRRRSGLAADGVRLLVLSCHLAVTSDAVTQVSSVADKMLGSGHKKAPAASGSKWPRNRLWRQPYSLWERRRLNGRRPILRREPRCGASWGGSGSPSVPGWSVDSAVDRCGGRHAAEQEPGFHGQRVG